MSIKEIKKMLNNYKFNKLAVAKRQQHLENLKSIILKASKRKDDISSATQIDIEVDNLKKLIAEEIIEEKMLYNEIKTNREIELTINTLSQPSKTILLSKYVLGLTFDEIANDLFYSSKRIYQLHSIALVEFKDKYENQICKEI